MLLFAHNSSSLYFFLISSNLFFSSKRSNFGIKKSRFIFKEFFRVIKDLNSVFNVKTLFFCCKISSRSPLSPIPSSKKEHSSIGFKLLIVSILPWLTNANWLSGLISNFDTSFWISIAWTFLKLLSFFNWISKDGDFPLITVLLILTTSLWYWIWSSTIAWFCPFLIKSDHFL